MAGLRGRRLRKTVGVVAPGFVAWRHHCGIQVEGRFEAENGSSGGWAAVKIPWYAKKMRDRFRLGRLENDALLAALSSLVQRERQLLSDFLAHLAELDERRLYLELGFPSLFAFCTEALGLSKSAAGRRIAAARVCRRFPQAFALAARGELELSVLCELSKYLNAENARELFEACSGKSYEFTLEVLAARFPKPDLRDSIRRMPVRSVEVAPDIGCAPGAETTAGSVTATAAGSVTATTAGSVTATAAGSVTATTAGSVTATAAGSVTATTAGSVTATTAGSVTALGATAQGAASFTLKPTVARDSPVISGILMAPTAPV